MNYFKFILSLIVVLGLTISLHGQCDFMVSDSSPCAGEIVTFTATTQTGDPNSYNWDFNNDGISDGVGFAITSSFPSGQVTIKLTHNGMECNQIINVQISPDATISVTPSFTLSGNIIRTCTGDADATVQIINQSSTLDQNQSYEVNWGDGVEMFTNDNFNQNSPISHNYNGFGYHDFTITTTGNNGCVTVANYQFYNGGNPSITFGNPGNTVGICAPETISFPITDVANNPPGTVYTIFINGEEVQQYNQTNIPSTFDYTFTEASCNLATSNGEFEHAFDVKIEPSNPCGTTAATVEPIEVTTPPIPLIGIDYPTNSCPEEIFTFTNNSTDVAEVISGNPTECIDELPATWQISPGEINVDWEIISGSLFGDNEIEVAFNFPGSYTITMTVISQACGNQTVSETVTVLEPPTAAAALSQGNDNCISNLVDFDNQSTGFDINFLWEINPPTGWNFANNTNANSEHPAVNFTQAGEYDIKLTTRNVCDFDTWETTLVFITTPSVTLDPIDNGCNTESLSFSNDNVLYEENGGTITSYDWSFPGGNPSTSSEQYPTNIQYDTPGSYTVSVTATNECGPSTTTQTFTIQEPVDLELPDDLEFCINDPAFQLTANIEPGTWTGDGVNEDGLFMPLEAGEGIHVISYTQGNGVCSSTETMQITVFELPIVEIVTPPIEVCVDESNIDLSATPINGDWEINNNGVITNNQFSPSDSGAGNFEASYTFTDENGCLNTEILQIKVYSLPEIFVNDATYCNTNGTVDLPLATPPDGIWSGLGVVDPTGIFNPEAISPQTSTELTYTYTDDNGCSNSATITVTITDPDNVSAGEDMSFCESITTFDLNTISSSNTGDWTTISSGLNGSIFNPQQAGVGIHILTYTIGEGSCEVSDHVTIEVLPLPIIDISSTPTEACISTEVINLIANHTTGEWSSPNGGIIVGDQFFPPASGEGIFTLVYDYTDNSGCNNSDNLSFEVYGLPEIIVNDTTYCNTPGLVNLPFVIPSEGEWSGEGVVNSDGMFDPQTVALDTPIPLVYAFTDENDCFNSDTISVTVINPADVSAGQDTSFCESVISFDLSSISSPQNQGTWSSTSNGLNGSVFNPQEAGVGIHTLNYAVGQGNCEVSDEMVIEVFGLPVIDIASNPLSSCISADDIPLMAEPPGGEWNSPDGGVLNGNIFSPTLSGEGTFTLIYEFADGNECANTASIEFIVNPLPNLVVNDTTYCNTPGTVSLPNASPDDGTWTGIGVVDAIGVFEPEAAGGVGIYQLTYTFADANNCADSTTVTIEVIDPVTIEAGNDSLLCVDNGLHQLTNFIPESGGTWSGTGIVDAQNGIFDPSLAGGGIHTLTYSFGNGNCEVQDVIQMEVIDVISGISAGEDEEKCLLDGIFTLTGNTPADGMWSGTGITDAIAGTFNPTLAGAGTHTITYSFEDSESGCTASATKQIIVHPMPESAFSIPAEACLDQDILFTNESQDSTEVLWDFGDGGTSTLPNPIHVYTTIGTYTIILTTTTEHGCTDETSQTLFITEPPLPYFEPDINEGCAVLQVNFDNQSTGYDMNFEWDFGNGQSSTEEQPETIAFEQGTTDTTYIISLTANNLCASVTYSDTITVFPLPLVEFSPNIDTSCTPMTVSFVNVSLGNPETYFWDYGNGISSTDSIPITQIYYTDTIPTTYTISLISTNFCGADTATYDILVNPVDVTAFFNIPAAQGCQPFTVQFSNFSSTGAAVFYDFGDGETSDQNSPQHTFIESGTFTVTQYASNGCGYDSTLMNITVLPAPIISFTNETEVCAEQETQFINTSEGLSGVYWDFGDSTTSELNNPFHAYDTSEIYTITLTGISTLNGCEASMTNTIEVLELPIASFEPSDIDGCVPHTVDFSNNSLNAAYYDWDFGDGNTSNLESPSHIFADTGQFVVKLIIRDENNCYGDTTFFNIFVFPVPETAFDISIDNICGIPVEVDFTNLTPEGTANGFIWNFGDGQSSTFTHPSNTYTAAGDYTVQLIAANLYNCVDTINHTFTAYEIPSAVATTADIEGCAPYTVDFANLSQDANTYYWDFGNGATSNEANPSYTYQEAGFYTPQLIISMNDVCFDTLVFSSQIAVRPSPFANFEALEIETNPSSAQFEFLNLSEDAISYFWDFGDGDTSEEESPIHRYYSNGAMQVYLEVTSLNACTDDTLLTVLPNLIKGLFIPNALMPSNGIGEAAVFQPKGVGLKEYEIEIFSTYGEQIWSSTALSEGQPTEFWDGTLNGQPLDQDVYVWKVKTAIFDDGSSWLGMQSKDGEFKTMGSVTLIR